MHASLSITGKAVVSAAASSPFRSNAAQPRVVEHNAAGKTLVTSKPTRARTSNVNNKCTAKLNGKAASPARKPIKSKTNTPPSNKSTDSSSAVPECLEQQDMQEVNLNQQIGLVRVRYNHYNQEFTLLRSAYEGMGRTSWDEIDEAYCISYVFRGDFRTAVVDAEDGTVSQRNEDGFFDQLSPSREYELRVVQDEEAEAAAAAARGGPRTYNPSQARIGEPTAASKRLTEELKGLSLDELKTQSDKYKELIEARDLEDVLYGAG